MSTFTAVVVSEDQVVVGQRGREAKPMLADAFAELLATPVEREGRKYKSLSEAVKAGAKSDWFLAGDASEVKLRSAAKFFGFALQFAKTPNGDPVFRFAGDYTPRPRLTEAEKAEKATAKK